MRFREHKTVICQCISLNRGHYILILIQYPEINTRKSEGIRVLIYPAEKYSKSVGGDKAVIEKHMAEIVEEVNKELQSYKKITKITVVDAPMPMTSTKKIKRFEVKAMYDED